MVAFYFSQTFLLCIAHSQWNSYSQVGMFIIIGSNHLFKMLCQNIYLVVYMSEHIVTWFIWDKAVCGSILLSFYSCSCYTTVLVFFLNSYCVFKICKRKQKNKLYELTLLINDSTDYRYNNCAICGNWCTLCWNLQSYLKPLKQPESSPLCDPSLVDEMFYQIPEILEHHELFLEQVISCVNDWHDRQTIGDLLVQSVSTEHSPLWGFGITSKCMLFVFVYLSLGAVSERVGERCDAQAFMLTIN